MSSYLKLKSHIPYFITKVAIPNYSFIKNGFLIKSDYRFLFEKDTNFTLSTKKSIKGSTPIVPKRRTTTRFSIPDSVSISKSEKYFEISEY